MELPEHTARLVESRLSLYCQRICPAAFGRQVRLGYRIDAHVVTLFELRPAWCTASELAEREHPVARFLYDSRDGSWRFQHLDPGRGWRNYRRLSRSRDFMLLLREIDADPDGVFFSRVNGASLRWCCSRGRCAPCDARYRSILGLDRANAPG